MKYLILQGEKVVDAYEQDPNTITLHYPGYQTEAVNIDDDTWEKIKKTPGSYTYKDGKVILLAKGE